MIVRLLVSICVLLNLFLSSTYSQVDIVWQKCLGGLGYDYAYSIIQTTDGGYIVAGKSDSNDGDVSGNHGGNDSWVAKLNSSGEIEWQDCYGGSGNDYACSINQTTDGGYIVAGISTSTDGDVSGNHGGSYDYWVVKLNSLGTIEWDKCLGGSGSDHLESIMQTTDGGYIAAGWSNSDDGDVSVNHGEWDYWVVKLNSLGTIEWDKCLGGSNYDWPFSIIQTTDGGYIVAGRSCSSDGDVIGHNGGYDYWVVKLNSLDEIEWKDCYGGSGDELAESISQTTDGGYIVAGWSSSTDGDVIGNNGDFDYWVVKLNSLGGIEWQKCLGGSSREVAYSIIQTTDGGYIVAGKSSSTDGDVSCNHGYYDYWVVKLNSLGEIEWEECYGGSGDEIAESIIQTTDGGYIVAGGSGSTDGDVSGQHGAVDYWVVFLYPVNQPPAISTDHTTVTVDEGQIAANTGTVSDPDGDPATLSSSIGTITNYNNGTWYWEFTTSDGPIESQTVAITADDGKGGTDQETFDLNVVNVAPTVENISIPLDPIAITDQPLVVSATFSDPAGVSDEPYTCTFNYGDGTGDQAGTVNGTTCTGPDHTYESAGVYTVSVTVTDKDGDSAHTIEFIVIYDHSEGFVTGGGWINSPVGAYIPDPLLTGKANFGFVSKYKKGHTVPTGNTEFQFHAGDLNFHSDSYEWLVITNHKAMYKGVGKINGDGNFGFRINAIDAALTPSTDVDMFRIRIWDIENDDALIYDNELSEEDPNADPMTPIGGGSIVIHKKGFKKDLATEDLSLTITKPKTFQLLQNYPNPFNPTTTIQFALPEETAVLLEIYNSAGQLIETLVNESMGIGNYNVIWDAANMPSGIYFYRIKAGSFHDLKKMILMK